MKNDKKKRPSARARADERSVGTVAAPAGAKLRVIEGGKGNAPRLASRQDIGAWLRLAAASELGLDFAIPGLVLP